MNIVINSIPLLSTPTGIGNCIYNISKCLLKIDKQNKYTFYYGFLSGTLQSPEDIINSGNPDFKFIMLQRTKLCIGRVPFIRDLARRTMMNRHKVVPYVRKFDVYYEPNFIPVGINAKRIVTALHDFSFVRYPEWHPKDRIDYFRKYFCKRIYKSDLITTDSNYVKGEVKQFLKIDENRIRVVHMGYDKTIFKHRDDREISVFRKDKELPENYILFVGSLQPRKNIERLLLAYMQLPGFIKEEFKLILVGSPGWRNKNIMELIDKFSENVRYLGYLSVRELPLLYNAAKMLVYPSLYEGFGLPPLEAMACGCPVVVSNMASLPEVCGDAAFYVNPHDVESIADGIYRVATDEELRKSMIRKGLQRAKIFSWEKSAKEHIKVFEEVITT